MFLLSFRVALLQGNEALKNQNNELKTLLNHYLSAKINEELLVPPVSLPQQRKTAQNVTQSTSEKGSRSTNRP